MVVKLTYVINSLTVGGAEKLLLATVKKLNKKKFDITVCSLMKENNLAKDFEQIGVKVLRLNMFNKRDIRGFLKLYNYFRTQKIDIVHTHLTEADIFGRFAALLAKVPVIISTEHSVDEWKVHPKKVKAKIRLLLNKIAANFSNGIVTVSDKVKYHLIKYENLNPAKIYVIKNGIEIAEKEDFFVSGKKKDTIVIGSVGRLCKEKGYDYLLKAFGRVKKKFSNAKLKLAGDGPLRWPLEELAHELHISADVSFLGVLDNVAAFLNEIDVFVLSSIQEGLPLSLLEAMAAEKTVITTAVGGIPEVVNNGIDAVLIPPANVEALENAIISVIKNGDRREDLGRNARTKILKQFNINKMVDELELLYDGLLKK